MLFNNDNEEEINYSFRDGYSKDERRNTFYSFIKGVLKCRGKSTDKILIDVIEEEVKKIEEMKE